MNGSTGHYKLVLAINALMLLVIVATACAACLFIRTLRGYAING